MSKISDALRTLKVFNTWEVLKQFSLAKRRAVAVQYLRAESRACIPSRVHVWSPYFDTDKKAHWHDNRKKTFSLFGKDRKQAMAEACEWASEKYGIAEWAVCPMDRSTLIPKETRLAALAAAKAVMKNQ